MPGWRLEDCKHLEEGRRTFGVCKSRTRRRALSKPIALKLRGRLQFADGQLLGRVGRLCLKAVTKHAYGNTGAQLSGQCRAVLVRFSDILNIRCPAWFLPLGVERQAGVTAWRQRVLSPSHVADEPSLELRSELNRNGQGIYRSEVTRILQRTENAYGQIRVDKSTSCDRPAFPWQVIACKVIGACKG